MPSAIQSCPIIIVQGPSFGKKGQLRAFIEQHFRGSKPLQIFTKLRPIIVYIYIGTTVACAFKWKSSAARSAFNLTAETQGLSSKVHSIGTTEPMRPGGTSAQTSRFISIAQVSDDSFQVKFVRLLRNSEPYVKTIGAYKESHYAQYSKENRRAQKI